MLEVCGLKGEFEVFLYDKKGMLKDYRKVKNLTTNAGFTGVCEAMGLGITAAFTYCAIGTGTITPDPGDSTLEAETARVAGGFTQVSTKVWSNAATFGAGTGTGAITESGLFNDASTGTLLCHQTFPVINKGASDTLVVTWQYTLS